MANPVTRTPFLSKWSRERATWMDLQNAENGEEGKEKSQMGMWIGCRKWSFLVAWAELWGLLWVKADRTYLSSQKSRSNSEFQFQFQISVWIQSKFYFLFSEKQIFFMSACFFLFLLPLYIFIILYVFIILYIIIYFALFSVVILISPWNRWCSLYLEKLQLVERENKKGIWSKCNWKKHNIIQDNFFLGWIH